MKPSKWQAPQAKCSKRRTNAGHSLCECNSDMMVAILLRRGNTNSKIFIKNYCILTTFF